MRIHCALIALLLGSTSLQAQSIGGNASLSVSTSTSAVQLPASTSQYPAVMLVPANGSTAEVFYKFGPSSIAATTNSPALPAGGICFVNVGSANNYIAAITASGSATLRITQLPYCPPSWAGSGGSNSGSGSSATDGSAFTSGVSTETTIGGTYFGASIPTLLSGQQGAAALSTNRELYIDIRPSSYFASQMATGTGTDGSAASTTGLLIGGYDGANYRRIKTASDGTVSTSATTTGAAYSHSSSTSPVTALVAKASSGNLAAFNCTGITGGAAGYCIAYNGNAAPSTGALTGSLVLDACYFDATPKGCNLSHLPNSIAMGTGIVILVTTASTPFTYTTGTATGFIEADYQ